MFHLSTSPFLLCMVKDLRSEILHADVAVMFLQAVKDLLLGRFTKKQTEKVIT